MHRESQIQQPKAVNPHCKMRPKFSICLFLLGVVLTDRIVASDIDNHQEKLMICLSKVMKKFYSEYITVNFVVPAKATWKIEALINRFHDMFPMLVTSVHTIDCVEYMFSRFYQVNLYVANTGADLNTVFRHLRAAKTDQSHVVVGNFYTGHNFSDYIKNMIPITRKGDKPLRVMFIVSIEGEIEVFGRPMKASAAQDASSFFKKLDVCGTKALARLPWPLKILNRSKKLIVKVAVASQHLPLIEAKDEDNPGGLVGEFMNLVKKELDIVPKYVWNVKEANFSKFVAERSSLYIAFNLRNTRTSASVNSFNFITVGQNVWVIIKGRDHYQRNIFAQPLTAGVSLYLIVFAIYALFTLLCLIRGVEKIKILLLLFGISIGNGVGWLPKKALNRFLMILWCWATFIILQAYLAALMSEFSMPIVRHNLANTEDLMESGTELICEEGMKQFYCSLKGRVNAYICEKCIKFNYEVLLKILVKIREKNLSKSVALNANTEAIKMYFPRNSYYVFEKKMGIWPSTAYTNIGGDMREKMMNISARMIETGIFQYHLNSYQSKEDIEEFKQNKFNDSDFNNLFVILYVGWSCGIVTFVIEILIKRYRKN